MSAQEPVCSQCGGPHQGSPGHLWAWESCCAKNLAVIANALKWRGGL